MKRTKLKIISINKNIGFGNELIFTNFPSSLFNDDANENKGSCVFT